MADQARALAVVLHDLAWLLPRTVDVEAEAGQEALPLSEMEVMRLLVRRPGRSVGEVARELGLQVSNVSAAVKALAARGLLERERDAVDARITRLRPTARATAIRDRREAAWGTVLQARLRTLDPDAAERLLAAAAPLRTLADALAAGG